MKRSHVYLAIQTLCVKQVISIPQYCVHTSKYQQINAAVAVNNRQLITLMILFMFPFRPAVPPEEPHSVK